MNIKSLISLYGYKVHGDAIGTNYFTLRTLTIFFFNFLTKNTYRSQTLGIRYYYIHNETNFRYTQQNIVFGRYIHVPSGIRFFIHSHV